MKKIIAKIILYISFIPYVYILLTSISAFFYGYDTYIWIKPTYIETLYGIEAFRTVFFWNILVFSVILILPICIIYQMIYLIMYIRQKQRNKQ